MSDRIETLAHSLNDKIYWEIEDSLPSTNIMFNYNITSNLWALAAVNLELQRELRELIRWNYELRTLI